MKQTKLICLVLSLIIILSSCYFTLPEGDASFAPESSVAAEASFADTSSAANDVDEGDRPHFSDIEYVRPDYDHIESLRSDIEKLVKDGKETEKATKLFEEYTDAINLAYSMSRLLSIYQTIDTTDEFVTDELNDIDELNSVMYEKYISLCELIIASDMCEDVLYDWTEDDFDDVTRRAEYSDAEFTALTTKQSKLINDYITQSTNMTFTYKGKEYYYDELDGIYGMTNDEYQKIYDSYIDSLKGLGKIYLELVKVNKAIAKKAGYDNFSDYCYDVEYGRDYTTSDSKQLSKVVKQLVVPKLDTLIDSFSQSDSRILSEYYYKDGLLESRQQLIVDYLTEMGMYDVYSAMLEKGYCHISDAPEMQDGAYTTYITSFDVPFICMKKSGGYNDLLTLIHEFGHFYPSYILGDDSAEIIDVCEIQSQANEFLFLKYFGSISTSVKKAITKYQLLDALYSIVYGCLYDEFQQTVYAGDYKTVEEINDVFISLCKEYGVEASDYEWVNVLHNFEVPLYYISYAVSIIPALEIFRISVSDRDSAIEIYRSIQQADSGSTFGEVLEDAGLSSPFAMKTMVDICVWIETQFK